MIRILLVDDHAGFRGCLRQMVQKCIQDCVIEEAESGGEAMVLARLNPPELVFMDIELPDANGLHLTRELKEERPETAIIVLTSHDLPEFREASLLAGASRFHSKLTLSFREMAETLLDLLPRRPG